MPRPYAEPGPRFSPACLDRLARLAVGPGDRDRERLDAGEAATQQPREGLVLDAGLEKAVDASRKLAVIAPVEADDRAAERTPSRIWSATEKMPNDSKFGQGMCQNVMMVARGNRSRRSRQECEVVVLDQHHRIVGLRFLRHGIGEAFVDAAVLSPVLVAKDRARHADVTQRPQAFVRRIVVVPALLLLGQPDQAQRVALLARRPKAAARIDHLAVRRAASVGDPRAGAGALATHRDQAARRALHLDSTFGLHMDVTLPRSASRPSGSRARSASGAFCAPVPRRHCRRRARAGARRSRHFRVAGRPAATPSFRQHPATILRAHGRWCSRGCPGRA